MKTRFLKAEMQRNGDSNHDLAQAIGVSDATCSLKVNGKSEFTRKEMMTIKVRYNLSAEQIDSIFFNVEVS